MSTSSESLARLTIIGEDREGAGTHIRTCTASSPQGFIIFTTAYIHNCALYTSSIKLPRYALN